MIYIDLYENVGVCLFMYNFRYSVFMIRVCIRLNNIGGALEFDLVAAAKIRSATAEFGLSSIA